MYRSQTESCFEHRFKIIELVRSSKNNIVTFTLPPKISISDKHIDGILDELESDLVMLHEKYHHVNMPMTILIYYQKQSRFSKHSEKVLYSDKVTKYFHRNIKKYYFSFDYTDALARDSILIDVCEHDLASDDVRSYKRTANLKRPLG